MAFTVARLDSSSHTMPGRPPNRPIGSARAPPVPMCHSRYFCRMPSTMDPEVYEVGQAVVVVAEQEQYESGDPGRLVGDACSTSRGRSAAPGPTDIA